MGAREDIEATLDEFHAAAAAADEERYLSTLATDAVFFGTAPGERWAGAAWREFVHSYFSRGKGWTYVSSVRSVQVSDDHRIAWFDETVENEHYGSCRGTGVVRQTSDGWKIEQYSLTLPVPDEIAPELVAKIRAMRPA